MKKTSVQKAVPVTLLPGVGMLFIVVLLLLAASETSLGQAGGTLPVTDLAAEDSPWDDGHKITLRWSHGSPSEVMAFRILRTRTGAELEQETLLLNVSGLMTARQTATGDVLGDAWVGDWFTLAPAQAAEVRTSRAAAAEAYEDVSANAFMPVMYLAADPASNGNYEFIVDRLEAGTPYRFRVVAVAEDGTESSAVETATVAEPSVQFLDSEKLWLLLICLYFIGAVVFFMSLAKSGKPVKVRKIAGLEAIDEAVGRATEMGRSVLFIPGIQDINEMQTITAMTILSRVSKTAAEYDAKVEVPTCRSLVMTTARETVQAAYLAAGRPDAYNEDLIYYVTDEQFGYVAYLSGMMVREKPAACIYMGAFFAESLILAETGNSIGAIQVAGTAMPAQLPFFVAACDYTLIGEEFFAAAAYLSGSPEELGSLKGQDAGKVLAGFLIILGVLAGTVASFGESTDGPLHAVINFLQDVLLA